MCPRDTKAIQSPVFLSSPYVQLEAAWSITNIASGTSVQTQYLINADAVPILVQLLSSDFLELREQV